MNQVVLVGAGCGKSTITLEAARLLSRCDCVVYDSLLDDGLLELCPPDCKKVFVGKRAGHHSAKQEEINRILVDCGKEYPLTVRLKGGDPFVFGRGGEELLALEENGIQGYAVPGISSCIAAAELAGIPITHRGWTQGFQVHTAHTADKEIDFTNLGISEDTLVFLMAKQAAGKIHSDFERGFIRAEVVAFDDLMACGSMAAAKEKGLVRLEGKEYVMQDGDIVLFRFNV